MPEDKFVRYYGNIPATEMRLCCIDFRWPAGQIVPALRFVCPVCGDHYYFVHTIQSWGIDFRSKYGRLYRSPDHMKWYRQAMYSPSISVETEECRFHSFLRNHSFDYHGDTFAVPDRASLKRLWSTDPYGQNARRAEVMALSNSHRREKYVSGLTKVIHNDIGLGLFYEEPSKYTVKQLFEEIRISRDHPLLGEMLKGETDSKARVTVIAAIKARLLRLEKQGWKS